MEFLKACETAFYYFKKELGIEGLSTITENDTDWFFSCEHDRIGSTIISISKADGQIAWVDILSDEGYETLKSSKRIETPADYSPQ